MKGLILLLTIALSTSAFGQAEPRKFDEFGKIPCEDLLARADNFAIEMSANPQATAVVVVSSGSKSAAAVANQVWQYLTAQLDRSGIALDRVQFYRDPREKEPTGTLWVVPAGARFPSEEFDAWSDGKVFDFSKPFEYGRADELDICSSFSPSPFAKILRENPEVVGKVIVRAERRTSALQTGTYWIDVFRNRGIPRSRLRLIIGKRSAPMMSYTEFWIVPAKKRRQ